MQFDIKRVHLIFGKVTKYALDMMNDEYKVMVRRLHKVHQDLEDERFQKADEQCQDELRCQHDEVAHLALYPPCLHLCDLPLRYGLPCACFMVKAY